MRAMPYGDTVFVLRPTTPTKDRYGNPVPGDPIVITYDGCAVYTFDVNASGSNEVVQGVDLISAGLTVLLPDGADVRATDQVRARGIVWDVTGEPATFRSPLTNTGGGVEVHLTRYRG